MQTEMINILMEIRAPISSFILSGPKNDLSAKLRFEQPSVKQKQKKKTLKI